jgi:prepilin-type N-terminal cleavage/methylation domain-containing protein
VGNKNGQLKRAQQGFTIIELLLSLALVAAMVVLYQVALNTLKLNEIVRDKEIALRIAQNKMEELRNTPYNSLPASSTFSDTLLSSLASSSGSITVSNYSDTVKQVSVIVQWHRPGTQSNSSITLTTLMKQNGFTLIETLVVIAVFAVVVLVLLNLFDRHGALYTYEQAQLAVSGGSRITMTEVNTYASQAYRIMASADVGGTTYTSGTTTLVLQIPTVNSSGNIVADTWDYAVFTLTGASLTEIIQPDGQSARPAVSRLLSDIVSGLSFTYDNPDLAMARKVNVSLTTAQQVRNQIVRVQLDQDIYLKNYH